MLKTEEREIGGTRYQVSQLMVPAGRKLLVRLTKVLGPVVGALLRGAEGKAGAERISATALSDAITQLAAHLTDEDLTYVCDILAPKTQVCVGPDQWVPLQTLMDTHFAGRYEQMFRWIAFAIEVNYSGFFVASGGIAGLVSRFGASPSESPTASTGSSGGS